MTTHHLFTLASHSPHIDHTFTTYSPLTLPPIPCANPTYPQTHAPRYPLTHTSMYGTQQPNNPIFSHLADLASEPFV